MSKLHESREKTLPKPLGKEELGYLFEHKLVSSLVMDLKNKKYGSYLIGGIVGTGKTSQVEIASNLALKNPMIIHINLYNQGSVEKFEECILRELISEVRKCGLEKNCVNLKQLTEYGETRLYYEINEKVTANKNKENGINHSKINECSHGLEMEVGVPKGQRVFWKGAFKKSNKSQCINSECEQETQNAEYIRKQPALLQCIYSIIEEITDNEIIFIYDEIDKMREDIIKDLFTGYKELFVEKDIYNFFIVNESLFRKYSDSNLCKNPVYSYFMEEYYTPLLDYKKTLRYIKMMFAEQYYLNGLTIYYKTLGNYRLINQRYLSPVIYSDLDVIKAYIYKKVSEKLLQDYMDDYMVDMLKVKVKSTIEDMLLLKKFNISDFSKKMQMEYGDKSIWPDYTTVIKTTIEIIENICSDSIEKKGEIVEINWECILSNYTLITNKINVSRDASIEKDEQEFIHITDMYKHWEYNLRSKKKVILLRDNILLQNVAVNEPKSYREILTNIVYSNLDNKHIQAIVLKRARGERSFYSDDYEYSGIVIVDKENFQIAYYVDRGGYKSENKEIILQFKDDMNKLNVTVTVLEAMEEISINNDFQNIASRYNNPYSECYEDMTVVNSNLDELYGKE